MLRGSGLIRGAIVSGVLSVIAALLSVVPATGAGATATSITGTVTQAGTGQPLAGVCVSAEPEGVPDSTSGELTDSNGDFAFPTLPAGAYDVWFTAGPLCGGTNDATQFYDGSATLAGAQPVVVVAGSTTTSINAALQPGGSIAGIVTDLSSGAALPGVCVLAAPSAAGPGSETTTTGSDGTYSLSGLNTGTYFVSFFSPGSSCGSSAGQYAPQWYPQQDTAGGGTPVQVTVGQATDGIDAVLHGAVPSVLSVAAAPAITTPGQPVLFAANVSGQGGTPSGWVAFATDGQLLCVAKVTGAGEGVCTSSAAPAGTDTIITRYLGDDVFAPSSGTTTISVGPPHGYWLVGGDGGIFTFGAAQFFGSTGSLELQRPVVGITPTSNRDGYWLVASDGGIFSFGDAGFYGSIPGLGFAPAGTRGNGKRLNAPVVGMVPSADGDGYFMVAADGGVFAFGDARFEGSCPAIGGCAGPAVAVVPDATGGGYWVVTATGHVYSFGDARYYGAPGPAGTVTSAVRTPDGGGYWILLGNGTADAFGDARDFGSLPAGAAGSLNPAMTLFATADGGGYWVVTANGAVSAFGDAPNDGGRAGTHLNAPIIAGVGW